MYRIVSEVNGAIRAYMGVQNYTEQLDEYQENMAEWSALDESERDASQEPIAPKEIDAQVKPWQQPRR